MINKRSSRQQIADGCFAFRANGIAADGAFGPSLIKYRFN